MTCEKEVTPSGTGTVPAFALRNHVAGFLTLNFEHKVLAIIANRFSFVFNLKGPF